IFYAHFKCTGSPSNTSSLTIDGSATMFEVDVDDGVNPPGPVAHAAVAGQIYIDQPNRAPVVTSIADKIVDELTLLTFTATASDADGSVQTEIFSLDPGAPSGASIGA